MINELSPSVLFIEVSFNPAFSLLVSFQHLGGQENSAGTNVRSFNIAAKSGVNPLFTAINSDCGS